MKMSPNKNDKTLHYQISRDKRDKHMILFKG